MDTENKNQINENNNRHTGAEPCTKPKSRKKYMKEYYLKKKHNMVNGEYVKQKPKPNKVPPLKITRGTFVVKFD